MKRHLIMIAIDMQGRQDPAAVLNAIDDWHKRFVSVEGLHPKEPITNADGTIVHTRWEEGDDEGGRRAVVVDTMPAPVAIVRVGALSDADLAAVAPGSIIQQQDTAPQSAPAAPSASSSAGGGAGQASAGEPGNAHVGEALATGIAGSAAPADPASANTASSSAP